MENQVDPKLLRAVSTTQKMLGEFVSKPVLSDKHLSKPPFRFLHEIITNVVETTGFLKNALTPEEFKYETFSDVEEKRVFLRKIIDAIEYATGEKCGARPSKILAGKEADKTNGLLQLLAKGIKTATSKDKETKESQKKKENKDKSKKEGQGAGGHETNKPKSSEAPKTSSSTTKTKEGNSKKSKARTRPIKKPSTTSVTESKPKPTKSRHASDAAVPAAAAGGNERRPGSSGTKSFPLKATATPSGSSSSTKKESSQESIKSVSSKLKSSSSTSLAAKTPSLLKIQSKQNLLPMKSSTSKLTIAASKDPSKTDIKQADLTQSQSRENVTKKDITNTDDGLTPALQSSSKEDIPLQRPVTRTKYRQKDNNEEMTANHEESQSLNPETDECESKIIDESKNAPEDVPTNDNVSKRNDTTIIQVTVRKLSTHSMKEEEAEQKEGSDGAVEKESTTQTRSGLSPTRSSSSEEVVTEHMNKKISEWRASTARTASEETLSSSNSKTSQEGIDSHEQSDRSSNGKNCSTSSVKAVKSEERENDREYQAFPIRNNIRKQQRSNSASQFPPAKRPITVLMDNEDDEEDEVFLVQEKFESDRDISLERIQQGMATMKFESLAMEHRGLLVNQIMETQRELEQFQSYNRQNLDMQTEMAEKDKEAMREVYLKQVETLKNSIQKMAKCATPLANITQRSQDDACLMEIEFRKLRQENERLQRKIDEAKTETSKCLYPLTEELALLDGRIEKMEGAIVLAKQRLHIMDEEYLYDFIEPVCQTTTGDEEFEDEPPDLLWKFAGGRVDDDDETKIENKSLLNVFRRALCIHDHDDECGANRDNFPRRNPRIITKREDRNNHRHPLPASTPSLINIDLRAPGSSYFPVVVNERSSLTNSSSGNHACNIGGFYTQLSGMHTHGQVSGGGSLLPQYPQIVRERPVDSDIKPPWWD